MDCCDLFYTHDAKFHLLISLKNDARMFFLITLLFALLTTTSLFAAPEYTSWHLLKNNELGRIPPSGVLRSFSLEDRTHRQANIWALIFQEKDFSMIVVDKPMQDKSLLEATEEASCVAGINGGYFQLNGTPLGLLLREGQIIHPQQRSNILSGFFVSTTHGMSILRLGEIIPSDAMHILQAGPFLLDQAQPVTGLESTKKANRSFLATNGQGVWMIGIISPVTLSEASHILNALGSPLLPGKKITRALNLDGGSSSSFWAGTKPTPFSFRTDVCVRNYLGVKVKL